MHIESFDNLEDMFAAMAKATYEANDAICDAQRAVTYGSCWARFAVDLGIIVFGQVMTLEEVAAGERKVGSTETEIAASLIILQENHQRGYMFGRAYSVWEPGGELGDTHRANLWPITKPEYEAARLAEWHPARIGGDWLHEAYMDYRAWALARFTTPPS